VDCEKIKPQRSEQSNLDTRIRAVSAPVLLVNLGEGKAVPAATNASAIAPMFPQAEHVHVPDLVHFRFLGECIAIGEKITDE